MKKVVIFSIILLFTPCYSTIADVMNPEFLTLHCDSDEIEVSCSFSYCDGPFKGLCNDECATYKDKLEYRYLSGHGSSFGGSQKFCRKKQGGYTKEDLEQYERKKEEIMDRRAEEARQYLKERENKRK